MSTGPDATQRTSHRAALLVQIAGAMLLLGAAFGARLSGEFVWDDFDLVQHNRALYAPGGWLPLVATDIWRPATGDVTAMYHPIPMLTLRFQARFTGPSLPAFRVGNLAIHAACGFLLFLLLARWGVPSAQAVLLSWIFLVHPSVTEVVMWLTGRHDSLGVAACLGALLMAPREGEPWTPRRTALAGLLCAVAALCHERYVIAPALLVLVDLWRGPAGPDSLTRRLARWSVPFACVLAVFALRALLGIRSGSSLVAAGAGEHARTIATILAHYVPQLLLFRNGPTIQTYRPLAPAASAWVLLAALGILAVAVGGARRRPGALGGVALGLAWFLLGFAPQLLSLPIAGMFGNRYAYFPWAGIVVALGFAWTAIAARWPRSARRAVMAGVAGGVVLLDVRTSFAAKAWHDEVALFGADAMRYPRDAHSVYHYGTAIRRRDGCEAALPQFLRATELDPAYPQAWHEAANCLLKLGRPVEAIPLCLREVGLEPRIPAGFRQLGIAYIMAGRDDDAMRALNECLRLQPGHPETLELLAIARRHREAGAAAAVP